MFTLYYLPHTRAGRVRWMLEEVGAPYRLHRVDAAGGEHRRPEYLAGVHPLGRVPTLSDGTTTMFESAAIIAWLADRFAESRLAPAPPSPARAPYYQWIFYATTELEPHCQAYMLHTTRLPEDKRIPAVAERARAALNANLSALEQLLGDGRQYLLGEFSAADVVAGWVAAWAFGMRIVDERPLVKAWSKRCAQRPANARARAD